MPQSALQSATASVIRVMAVCVMRVSVVRHTPDMGVLHTMDTVVLVMPGMEVLVTRDMVEEENVLLFVVVVKNNKAIRWHGKETLTYANGKCVVTNPTSLLNPPL